MTTHDAGRTDFVIGEALEAEPHGYQLRAVSEMERAAGYRLAVVEVVGPGLAYPHGVATLDGIGWAWAYVWPAERAHGDRILNGDWSTA
jgi:gamma-glutamylcyclotransferase (GGCT)/AIG2-like uncharacterized protein YtfP